jgi:hypothetical protein
MDEEKNDEQAQEGLEQTLPIVLSAQDDTVPLLEQLARIAKEVGGRSPLGFFEYPDEVLVARMKRDIEAEEAIHPRRASAQWYLDNLLGTSLQERNRRLYGMFLPMRSTLASSEDEQPAQTVAPPPSLPLDGVEALLDGWQKSSSRRLIDDLMAKSEQERAAIGGRWWASLFGDIEMHPVGPQPITLRGEDGTERTAWQHPFQFPDELPEVDHLSGLLLDMVGQVTIYHGKHEQWAAALSDKEASSLVALLGDAIKPFMVKQQYRRIVAQLRRQHRIPRARSSRHLAVQAKRAALGLPPDGKYAGWSRKESYRIAMEHQRRRQQGADSSFSGLRTPP